MSTMTTTKQMTTKRSGARIVVYLPSNGQGQHGEQSINFAAGCPTLDWEVPGL